MDYNKTLDSMVDFEHPYMFVWFDSEDGHHYRVLLEGRYEYHEDGNSIVYDVLPKGVERDGVNQGTILEEDYPEDLNNQIEALLEDKDTYMDMLEWHEQALDDNYVDVVESETNDEEPSNV